MEILIAAEQMRGRGLPALFVRADVTAAQLPRAFMLGSDEIAALRGPPGGTLAFSIWDCSGYEQTSLAGLAEAKLAHPSVALQVGLPTKVVLAGSEREAITVHEASPRENVAWLLVRIHEQLVFVFAVSAGAEGLLPASRILSQRSLRTLADTLHVAYE